MKLMVFVIICILSFVDLSNQQQWHTSEITAYQFHTYFLQNNQQSEAEALSLRESIQEITETVLAGCRLSRVNYDPTGPNIIGSYETCCSASSLIRAQSFFMLNHGNLSILLHPLTRYEVLDYTTRAMWLGKSMPLDISTLREDIGDEYDDEDKCFPKELDQDGGADFITTNLYDMVAVLVLYFCVNYKMF